MNPLNLRNVALTAAIFVVPVILTMAFLTDR
jgi:hypothetical protein